VAGFTGGNSGFKSVGATLEITDVNVGEVLIALTVDVSTGRV